MGSKTSILPAAALAAAATYLSDQLGLSPELAALAVGLASMVILYFVPDEIEAKIGAMLKGLFTIGPFVLVFALAGCTLTAPSWRAGEFISVAILDRAPGDDQQHEARTVTGFSLRDLSLGVASSDVTRNPVSDTGELHAAGFRREQQVSTALGDSIDSDLTSGNAFEAD
jgi:hypothetical protein